MDQLIERGGEWLAGAFAVYGLAVIVLPSFLFVYALLLGGVAWGTLANHRGRQAWPGMPSFVRKWARLGIEIVFGLLNPVLYLSVLAASMPGLQSNASWWHAPLAAVAWILLAAFWGMRLFGAALDPSSRVTRSGVRLVLVAALACVLTYAVKDALLVLSAPESGSRPGTLVLNFVRICPLYLIPAVLLWDYIRATSMTAWPTGRPAGRLFLLPNRLSRVAVAVVAGAALVTVGLTLHRRSDVSARTLVSDHRDAILAAAARHDVDPRLVASIVYVTHRDQLSPFRASLERLVVTAWAQNLRGWLGIGPPDGVREIGTDVNPLLNRALDISVGLAQIKPRTAQTASVLALGLRPNDLPEPVLFAYRDVEPIGDRWSQVGTAAGAARLPVTGDRALVARTLLDARSNLDTCALILSLYQRQWEAANPAWSLRRRPDILATLYQIGFARSRPHARPMHNDFGRRVQQVSGQSWLADLLEPGPRL